MMTVIIKNAARKFVIYNQSPESIGRLRKAFSLYSWSGLINAIICGTIDVSIAFDDFCAIVKWHLQQYIPTRTVLVRHKDLPTSHQLLRFYYVKETD